MSKKIRIQTALATNFGQSVMFGEITLKFDRLGFCEVESQDLADQLVDNYSGWLFIEKAPEKVEKPADDSLDVLQKEIGTLKQSLEQMTAQNEVIQKECDDWKLIAEKAQKDAQDATTELSGYKTQKQKEIEELNLRIKLMDKNMKELAETAASMDLPEEKYKGKPKNEIIDNILEEARK